MKVYLARESDLTIEVVEAERVSEASVWIRHTGWAGSSELRMHRRIAWPGRYCDTFEEAKAQLITWAEERVALRQRSVDNITRDIEERYKALATIQSILGRVRSLEESDALCAEMGRS